MNIEVGQTTKCDQFTTFVEQMKECQRAARILALQCFNSDLERRDETCAGILSDAKHFILYLKKGNVLYSIIVDDISLKISNVKLNIIDVCNLITLVI